MATTNEKLETRISCRFLTGAVISMNSFVEMILPVNFVRVREDSEHREEGTVKTFNLSIPLGMVRHGVRIFDVTKLFQLMEESIFEVSPLVMVNFGRESKAGDEIIVKLFSGSFC